jgi:hypothetical protein
MDDLDLIPRMGGGSVWIGTCPLRPEEHGTERPLQNHFTVIRVALVAAARFLGGQLFVSFTSEIDPIDRVSGANQVAEKAPLIVIPFTVSVHGEPNERGISLCLKRKKRGILRAKSALRMTVFRLFL